MRVLIWHGWLLEGSGSNIATARVAEAFRARGHDVLVLCQERHPERYPWIDWHGALDGAAVPGTIPEPATSSGRCILLRPEIGPILPVFVLDPYEGFQTVRRFIDLEGDELDRYLELNVQALRAAARWHGSEICITGHAIPGPVIGKRALGERAYVAKIHGSDLEYAVRIQDRYRALAREGLEAARAVVGPSRDVLERCTALVPGIADLGRIVPPGVEVKVFHPMPRQVALNETADRLDADAATEGGRPAALDEEVERALARRDERALDTLASTYDQESPEPSAPAALRALSEEDTPIVGYLGKLIPQKGVELLLSAQRMTRLDTTALIVGFGAHRDWLAALVAALRSQDAAALGWLRAARNMPIPFSVDRESPDGERRVVFTGLLDHRYAPGALAAMDVLVVPSILDEAFGMVAIEGAASGALPLVARHSGLAEVAQALEEGTGRSGLFAFDPADDPVGSLAAGIDRLLSIPAAERHELGLSLSAFVAREWSWERTASRLLAAAEPMHA